MTNEDVVTIAVICAWPIVGLIAAGVFREVKGRWPDDEFPAFLFWPIIVMAAIPFGFGWLLLNGTRRATRAVMQRNGKLPKAKAKYSDE